MKVIIPVAGIGKRLRPHTLTQPKPLMRIGNKTIIDYLLEPLATINPEEVIFVIGYMGEMIKRHVRDKYSFQATFVEQDKLLGLGYALHVALERVSTKDAVMVLLGDTVVECDLKRFCSAGEYVLGLRTVDDPKRFGIAVVQGEHVSELEEKPENPKGDQALIGLYYFSESGLLKQELESLVRSGKTTSGEIQLTDALASMITAGTKFVPYEVEGWYDCGKKETMLTSNQYLLSQLPAPREMKEARIIPPVYIGKDVSLENAIVGPFVSVFDGTRVVNSIVANSIVGAGATIRNMVIDHSIIGDNSVLQGEKNVLDIGDHTRVGDA